MNKDKFIRFNSGNSSELICYLGKTKKPVYLIIDNGNIYIKCWTKNRMLLASSDKLDINCKILLDSGAIGFIRCYYKYSINVDISLSFTGDPKTVGFSYGSFCGRPLAVIE